MVVLALARVRVDVQRGDLPVARDVGDGPGLDVGGPAGAVDLVVAHAVHLLGHAHHEAQALLRREVRAEGLVVDGPAVMQDPLGIEHRVPALQLRRVQRLAQVVRLGLAQLDDVVLVLVGHGRAHVVQELHGVRGGLHHATAQRELGVAGEAEQPGLFEARLRDLREHLQVVGAALVGLRAPEALARAGVLGRLHHRGVRRPVDGQRHLAVGVARLVLPHRLGHALELGIGERDADMRVADVAVELLAQRGQLVGNRLGAGLLVLGQRDAGILERLERELRGALVDRILERGHRLLRALVHELVHAESGLEVAPAHLALLGFRAHLGVRMHVLQEDERAALVLFPVVERLPALEPVRAGPALFQFLDAQHRALETGGAGRGHLRAAVEPGEREIRDRILDNRLDRNRLRVRRRARDAPGRRGVGGQRRQGQGPRQCQGSGNHGRSLHRVSGRTGMLLDGGLWPRSSGRAIVTACRVKFRPRCDQLQIYRPETFRKSLRIGT